MWVKYILNKQSLKKINQYRHSLTHVLLKLRQNVHFQSAKVNSDTD